MSQVLKTRKTELNPFCIENNVKRNNQLWKLKHRDLEKRFSVGSIRRGEEKRGKVSKESQSTAERQKEEVSSVSVLLHMCVCTRRRAEQCTV